MELIISKKFADLYSEEKSDKMVKCYDGKWFGRHFLIVRHYTGMPLAYIRLFQQDVLFQKIINKEITSEDGLLPHVHGGCTFSSVRTWTFEDETISGYYLGWDYAHYCDYIPSINCGADAHKFTLDEILFDVGKAIIDIEMVNSLEEHTY